MGHLNKDGRHASHQYAERVCFGIEEVHAANQLLSVRKEHFSINYVTCY